MRRAQLLSLDALLSIVLVILMLGAITSTSSALKGEIAEMLGWYERANIAENMLDVLTKNPGEPGDWYLNPSTARVVGLRDNNLSYAIDYKKFMTLNTSREQLVENLVNMSLGKDFKIASFVSTFEIGIRGSYPRVYLDNVTFANPRGNPPGVNFQISGGNGNTAFTVSYVEIVRGGDSYVNEDICSLKTGNTIDLQDGDRIRFILAQDVILSAKRGQGPEGPYIDPSPLTIPAGALVDIYIMGPEVSNFKLNFGGGSCPYSFKFSGKGNVVVTVSAYDSQLPEIISNYTPASVFEMLDRPTYWFAVINGSVVTDNSVVKASMNNSPWIQVERRIVNLNRFEYNLSAEPSSSLPMVYGVLNGALPTGAYFRVKVPDGPGEMAFVIVAGSEKRALFVYREDGEDLKAVIVRGGCDVNSQNDCVNHYSGNSNSIILPLSSLFGEPSAGDTIGMWFYSISGWNRDSVELRFVPSLEWVLEPKIDAVVIKLWVWDDS